jgi:hypothetical protein
VEKIRTGISRWAERTAQRLRDRVYERLGAVLERVCGANPLLLVVGVYAAARRLRSA